MKTIQNWMVWAIFYGSLAGILFLAARGDEYAPIAFQGIMWVRIITTLCLCFAMSDTSRILASLPRSRAFGAALLIAEGVVWRAMWEMHLYFELLATVPALLVYEGFRRDALVANP